MGKLYDGKYKKSDTRKNIYIEKAVLKIQCKRKYFKLEKFSIKIYKLEKIFQIGKVEKFGARENFPSLKSTIKNFVSAKIFQVVKV